MFLRFNFKHFIMPRSKTSFVGRRVVVGSGPGAKALNLLDIRERLIDYYRAAHHKPSAVRARLALQREKFKELERVQEYARRGFSPERIAAQSDVSVSKNTVRNWLKGTNLPWILSERFFAMKEAEKKLPKNIPKPADQNTDFAYLLGSVYGNANLSSDRPRLSLDVASRDFAKEFHRIIDQVIGRVSAPFKRVRRGNQITWSVFADSVIGVDEIKKIYGKHKIPLEYLRTPETRRAFLKALFDSHGYLTMRSRNGSKIRVIIFRKNNAVVMDFVKRVLLEEGIVFNCFTDRGAPALIIFNPVSLQKFKQAIGFTDKQHAARI